MHFCSFLPTFTYLFVHLMEKNTDEDRVKSKKV